MKKGDEEPEVLESEMKAATKKLKSRKEVGVGLDEIPAEVKLDDQPLFRR